MTGVELLWNGNIYEGENKNTSKANVLETSANVVVGGLISMVWMAFDLDKWWTQSLYFWRDLLNICKGVNIEQRSKVWFLWAEDAKSAALRRIMLVRYSKGKCMSQGHVYKWIKKYTNTIYIYIYITRLQILRKWRQKYSDCIKLLFKAKSQPLHQYQSITATFSHVTITLTLLFDYSSYILFCYVTVTDWTNIIDVILVNLCWISLFKHKQ